ncbi:MAG: hypothetical protein HOU01_21835 [Streptomycetaceae bacterium]|jgi:hypothetical protein|nr:hypothetical protein [Streptomycetaceae bacterium]
MPLSRITLLSGRTVELTALSMSGTYDGLVAGHPTERSNDRSIAYWLRKAERTYPHFPVHLVPPVRRPVEGRRAGPLGPPELLPAVTCTGLLLSDPVDPANEPFLWNSWLAVVWYQDTPDVPQGENALPALRALPWDELAADREE